MRKKEFMKKSEARIIIYLSKVANHVKHGGAMSDTLKIDYIYVMKLLRGMYEKGWVKVHQYQDQSYFEITADAPLAKAKEILTDTQSKINSGLRK